jgi:hypothetical protein
MSKINNRKRIMKFKLIIKNEKLYYLKIIYIYIYIIIKLNKFLFQVNFISFKIFEVH